MKVAILFQESVVPWRSHCELYEKDCSQAQSISNILEAQGIPTSIWSSLESYLDSRAYCIPKDELVFSLIENCFNRNHPAVVPSLFELMNAAYVGSDSYAHMVTADKKMFQDICRGIGLRCPRTIELQTNASAEMLQDKLKQSALSFPLVLKYRYGTMSYGLSLVENIQSLCLETERLLTQEPGSSVLCQEYISGHEITVPIVGTGINAHALGVIQYTGPGQKPLRMYDMEWKNELDELVHLLPLPPDASLTHGISSNCLLLHQHLHLRDMSRIDLRVTDAGDVYVLEANCIPFLGHGGAFDPVSYGGQLTLQDIILEITHSAWHREKRK